MMYQYSGIIINFNNQKNIFVTGMGRTCEILLSICLFCHLFSFFFTDAQKNRLKPKKRTNATVGPALTGFFRGDTMKIRGIPQGQFPDRAERVC